ncbi:hotdog fold thioesterase [Acidianus sulfidivorans JP7]|uniref:Esterase n=1 Tax=Acidianus sulfidivorans JP7 TaxID=619593 RepID=A0A2U9IPH6_9CREN|nr:PaaI family thioesterase [Acidianus sulfidivorans]AWR97940.1 hotdog fold thioesterase [Acidianus sulfidivorans JP7]
MNQDIEKIVSAEPVFSLLGAKIIELKEGYAKISIEYKPELTRRGGVLNGGIIMTAMDFAGGLSTLTVNDGIDQVTQELKTNFLQPMSKGPFYCEGKVIRKGRTTVVVEIKFLDSENKLGAIGLGTWFIIRERKIQKE